MLDIGISKLLIIGGLALVVVGPERLPRVARTLGTLMGRAQRYVSEVKAEVNRSMEVEELSRMKSEFQSAVSEVDAGLQSGLHQMHETVHDTVHGNPPGHVEHSASVPQYRPKKTKWRLRRSAMPHWYKQRERVRSHALSGAARVARYRPARLGSKR